MARPTDTVLRTVADELFDLVKQNKKISVDEAAKKLKAHIETVQSLVDFLVEEKIFGIEYKFTTPFIYLYNEGIKEAKGRDKGVTAELISKGEFYKKAKDKNVPYEHIEGLWRKYLQQNLVQMREEFIKKAKEKNVAEDKVEELWKKYLSYL